MEEDNTNNEQKLFQAILNNDKETVQDLLLQTDPELEFDYRNEEGKSTLDLATILGRSEILELLLQKCEITTNTSGKLKKKRSVHSSQEGI